jgi:hypothetical protein
MYQQVYRSEIPRQSAHTNEVCFVWTSEQEAIISLDIINSSIFIIDMERAYCPVRTESLYVIRIIICLQVAKIFSDNLCDK